MCFQVPRPLIRLFGPDTGGERQPEAPHDRARNRVLKGEHVAGFAVERVSPDDAAIVGARELGSDTNAVVDALHRAVEQHRDVQGTTDFRGCYGRTAERGRGAARGDAEATDFRQLGSEFVRHTGREILHR